MGARVVRVGVLGTGLLAPAIVGGPAAEAHPTGCNPPTIEQPVEGSRQATTPKPGFEVGFLPDEIAQTHAVDMDDDGTADTITVASGTLTVERDDGLVTVTGVPSTISFAAGQGSDLDGDGRDDLWTTFIQGFDIEATAILPSTIAPGTYAFADAVFSF